MSVYWGRPEAPPTPNSVENDPISDMKPAAALFLPAQFRMYDAPAKDLLFGVRGRETCRLTVIFWLHQFFFEGVANE
jgi:hypothetical protein